MASVETANVEMFHHERERCEKKWRKLTLYHSRHAMELLLAVMIAPYTYAIAPQS
jgi:hypothetical protein